ncbi:hypothetical protein VQ056_31465 [Paenibacillus sp. JTLBN-2024]
MRPFAKNKQSGNPQPEAGTQRSTESPAAETRLTGNLDDDLRIIKERTGGSSDLIIRLIDSMFGKELRIAVIYIEGLVNEQVMNSSVMPSLTAKILSIPIILRHRPRCSA